MSWMNSAFYILLLTSVSGSIVFGLWLLWEKFLERRQLLRCVFSLLYVVAAFFAIPVVYIVLKVSMTDYEKGIVYGILFTPTPLIRMIQCIVALVWIVGAVIYIRNYIKEYRAFLTIMKKNLFIVEPSVLAQKNRVQKRLGISKDIKVAMNYGVKVPVVCGWFHKMIVLPVCNYTEEQREIIFYHEMTHIKQHILEFKRLAVILRLIHWFNPVMNVFLNKVDEWGETECDLRVLENDTIPFSKKQYFDVALSGLEESDIWLPQMITQLKKEKNLRKRVSRMKGYKRETGMKLSGGITAALLFLAVSGTSVYAMGTGFCDFYEKVYDATVIEEMEPMQVEIIEEPYDENEVNVITADGIIFYSDDMQIEWNVPVNTLVKTEKIYLSKGDSVCISVNTSPGGKTLRAGLLTPYGTKRYVNGTGVIGYTFKIEKEGEYEIFVENTDSVAFTAKGYVSIY